MPAEEKAESDEENTQPAGANAGISNGKPQAPGPNLTSDDLINAQLTALNYLSMFIRKPEVQLDDQNWVYTVYLEGDQLGTIKLTDGDKVMSANEILNQVIGLLRTAEKMAKEQMKCKELESLIESFNNWSLLFRVAVGCSALAIPGSEVFLDPFTHDKSVVRIMKDGKTLGKIRLDGDVEDVMMQINYLKGGTDGR